MNSHWTRTGRRLAAGLGVTLVAALLPVVALGATGTATIAAGSLGFVSTPPNVTFSATLNGLDQTVSTTQALDVGDATGSGTGWNITATSTTFSTGGGSPHLLSTSATSLTGAPTDACDASATCTLATNSVTYPYVLPAGGTAPTATKMYNAAANTGLGNQTVTPTWRLSVPASTFAGTYTSTWTISLVSGP
jgi:hypothetical protein